MLPGHVYLDVCAPNSQLPEQLLEGTDAASVTKSGTEMTTGLEPQAGQECRMFSLAVDEFDRVSRVSTLAAVRDVSCSLLSNVQINFLDCRQAYANCRTCRSCLVFTKAFSTML